MSLTYEDGQLLRGTTRGNGARGRGHHAPTCAPSTTFRSAHGAGHGPALMEVRGEVYLPFRNFERVNGSARRRASRSSPTRATRRPAACARSIPRSPARRRLRMFAFTVEVLDGRLGRDHAARTCWTGWRTGASRWSRTGAVAPGIDAVQRGRSPSWPAALPTLPFAADGVVVKVDQPLAAGGARHHQRPRAALGHRAEVRPRGRGDAAAGRSTSTSAAPAR